MDFIIRKALKAAVTGGFQDIIVDHLDESRIIASRGTARKHLSQFLRKDGFNVIECGNIGAKDWVRVDWPNGHGTKTVGSILKEMTIRGFTQEDIEFQRAKRAEEAIAEKGNEIETEESVASSNIDKEFGE